MSCDINLNWYKQGVCYLEWAKEGNNFAAMRCCQLFACQYLECVGYRYGDSTLDMHAIVRKMRRIIGNAEFCDCLDILYDSGCYTELHALLYNSITEYVEPHYLVYCDYDINWWCADLGRGYVKELTVVTNEALDFLEKKSDFLIPLMCRYLRVSDLENCPSMDSLLNALYLRLNSEPVITSKLFREWCQLYCIMDRAKEYDRLMKLFNVSTPAELDRCLKLNMPKEVFGK